MTDYKKMIAEHSCKPNQGCGVMTICMCGVAEDMADEIERLRETLRRIRTAIFDAKPEVLTDTLWMHDRLGETVVDCIDNALDDNDWEVRDRAALGEKK